MDRKTLVREYKERESIGGIYLIMNQVTGQYLLGHTADLRGMRNRFEFSVTTGSCLHPRLEQDWKTLGASAFEFKILDQIDQSPEQSKADFMKDLQTLEAMWVEKLDKTKAYSPK